MSMDEKIKIDQEIARLRARRSEIEAKKLEENREFIRSLEWAKGITCRYAEKDFRHPSREYILHVHIPKIFPLDVLTSTSSLVIMGDSENIYENVLLKRDEHGLCISAYKADIFIKFLETVKPKIDSLDSQYTEQARILAAVFSCAR